MPTFSSAYTRASDQQRRLISDASSFTKSWIRMRKATPPYIIVY